MNQGRGNKKKKLLETCTEGRGKNKLRKRMEEEGNQPGKEMNQESENHSRFYLVNIFAKKKEKSKHWRGGGRGMLQEMSQIKGKVGAVWALQGRTEEGS